MNTALGLVTLNHRTFNHATVNHRHVIDCALCLVCLLRIGRRRRRCL